MGTINLERESHWRESLDLDSIVATVADYGSGGLPIIDGADEVASALWESTSTPNVYRLAWTLEEPMPTGGSIGVWQGESAIDMRPTLASLGEDGEAFVESEPYSTTALISLFATTDPRTAPDGTYEVSRRSIGVRVAFPGDQATHGASVTGVHARRACGPDGVVSVGRGATVRRVLAEEGGAHNILVGSGIVEDVTAWGSVHSNSGASPPSLFVSYLSDPTGEETTFRRTRARGTGSDDSAGYHSRGDGSLGHGHVRYVGASAQYCDTGFSISADATSLLADDGGYCYALGCRTAVDDAYSYPHALTIDGLLVRALTDDTFGFRSNERGVSITGEGAVVLVRNYAIVMDAGVSVFTDASDAHLVLENCVLYHTSPTATHNVHARAGNVTIRGCVIVGGNDALVRIDGAAQYIGEHNVFVPGSQGFRAVKNGGTVTMQATSLEAWREATGQDLDSIEVPRAELPALFSGDVTAGDFRIRLGASGPGPDARAMGAGLAHEIGAWPVLTATVADERARLASFSPAPPLVRLLTPYRLTETTQRLSYSQALLDDPLATRLYWLVEEILACYPDAVTDLDIVRCLRDWIARTAMHPHPYFHMNIPPGYGRETLPRGAERTDIVPILRSTDRTVKDSSHWDDYKFNGYAMLCDLLGLDNQTGMYNGRGQASRVGPGHWRINDIATFNFVLCSYQVEMLLVLLAGAGYQGMLISTNAHDPSAVWVPSLAKWVYNCPTWNETYYLDDSGAPLSPIELLIHTTAGNTERLVVNKALTASGRHAPTWAEGVYIDPTHPHCSYVSDQPLGFEVMGSQLNNFNRWREVGPGTYAENRFVMIDVPARSKYPPYNDPSWYAPCAPHEAFPHLGCVVEEIAPLPVGGAAVKLASGQHGSVEYERRVSKGAWEPCSDTDTVVPGTGAVHYRSLDAARRPSSTVSISA